MNDHAQLKQDDSSKRKEMVDQGHALVKKTHPNISKFDLLTNGMLTVVTSILTKPAVSTAEYK